MDSSGGHIGMSVLFVLMLAADFLLAAYGSALQTVSDADLDQAARESEKKAARAEQVREWKDEPGRFIHACWFWTVMTALPICALVRYVNGIPAALLALCLCLAVYLFGKSIPDMTGRKYDLPITMGCWRIAALLVCISFPFTFLLQGITMGAGYLIGIRPKDLEDEVTEDEIISMVNEGHEQGVLDEHEAEMIQNIFTLDDKQAQDIMIHRKQICAIRSDVNLMDAISFMVDSANSRFPVYEENIDNIIGILHFKDAMIFHSRREYDNWLLKDIPNLLRPAIFIPETRSIDELFRSMQAKKVQMVIVVDEYGETAGLVTMEDILEEIVGNIMDEYDKEESFITRREDGTFLMDGMTPLEDVEETLQISLGDEQYDTLNGYLIYRLDRIPGEDESPQVEAGGWVFQIRKMENNMIRQVEVSRATDPGKDPESKAAQQ